LEEQLGSMYNKPNAIKKSDFTENGLNLEGIYDKTTNLINARDITNTDTVSKLEF
jgi:hypothetical protein